MITAFSVMSVRRQFLIMGVILIMCVDSEFWWGASYVCEER